MSAASGWEAPGRGEGMVPLVDWFVAPGQGGAWSAVVVVGRGTAVMGVPSRGTAATSRVVRSRCSGALTPK